MVGSLGVEPRDQLFMRAYIMCVCFAFERKGYRLERRFQSLPNLPRLVGINPTFVSMTDDTSLVDVPVPLELMT